MARVFDSRIGSSRAGELFQAGYDAYRPGGDPRAASYEATAASFEPDTMREAFVFGWMRAWNETDPHGLRAATTELLALATAGARMGR